MDFAVPADHRIKLNVDEKSIKYLDFAEELKKLAVIPVGFGAFGTIPEGLVKRLENFEIRGQVRTMQTIA